jgi:hypothetical protein
MILPKTTSTILCRASKLFHWFYHLTAWTFSGFHKTLQLLLYHNVTTLSTITVTTWNVVGLGISYTNAVPVFLVGHNSKKKAGTTDFNRLAVLGLFTIELSICYYLFFFFFMCILYCTWNYLKKWSPDNKFFFYKIIFWTKTPQKPWHFRNTPPNLNDSTYLTSTIWSTPRHICSPN